MNRRSRSLELCLVLPAAPRLVRSLVATSVLALATACTGTAGPTASTSSAVPVSVTTPSHTTETIPALPPNEPLPSVGTETGDPGTTPVDGGEPIPPVVNVNAPTLGGNFTGVGDWHRNPGDTLTSLTVFTQGTGELPDYAFGLYAVDGEPGLVYVGGTVSPSTYFHLRDGCAGEQVSTNYEAADSTCNDLVFDPASAGSASGPFHAEMQLRMRLTCSGQDHPACSQLSPTPSSESPVTLTFTQSVSLTGSIGCDPDPGPDTPLCAVGSGSGSNEPPASGGGPSPESAGGGRAQSPSTQPTVPPAPVSSATAPSTG